jgi:adenosylmethionine-8-amino-7-oxononanoate aminotransferase
VESSKAMSAASPGNGVRADTRLWHPFSNMAVARHEEFVISRGEDVWVWDAAGRPYLDATASLWYANVGHGRAEIARAVSEQMQLLEAYSIFGDFSTEPALRLAERLAELAPDPESRVMLATGGGEAIDSAAKLARRYWHELGQPERRHILYRRNAYHGTNAFGTSLAGIDANRTGFGPLVQETELVAHDSVADMAQTVERLGPGRVAAVLVEPVIGAGGVHPPVPGYLEDVAELCRSTGVLFIADAVICGFGRLGTWFGVERWGLEPDLIVFAKGVTSGYLPLGGVIASSRVAEPFWSGAGAPLRHGATYAGHATCCAAGLANIALLERDGLLQRGRDLEGDLLAALAPLADHPLVAEVRGGTGLLAAIELDGEFLARHPDATAHVARLARDVGVLVRPLARALAVSPPLTVQHEHFTLIAEALTHALDVTQLGPPVPTTAS